MIYRKATMADIPAMHTLIQNYAKEGIMLRRPIMMLYESVRDFIVAVDEATNEIIGCGGLHILWSDLAEIRSLAVHPAYKGKGAGKGIVDYLVNEGKELGLGRIFALTSRSSSRSAASTSSRRTPSPRRSGRSASTAISSITAMRSPSSSSSSPRRSFRPRPLRSRSLRCPTGTTRGKASHADH